MADFTIRSIGAKGNFEVLEEDKAALYTVEYKSWFSSEANTSFGGHYYAMRSANFWQTQFEFFRDERNIARVSFNWKGEIIITYNPDGIEKEFLFQYKGVWKSRFILLDRGGEQMLAMVSSWSKLKYNYEVRIADSAFSADETNELLMICGYSANLYMNTMMGIF